MSVTQIVAEIEKLPLAKKLLVVEQVLHGIRQEEEKSTLNLSDAAALLLRDYLEDEELTAFTALDAENFYETK